MAIDGMTVSVQKDKENKGYYIVICTQDGVGVDTRLSHNPTEQDIQKCTSASRQSIEQYLREWEEERSRHKRHLQRQIAMDAINGIHVAKVRDKGEWVLMFDKDGYGVDVRITGGREPNADDIAAGFDVAVEEIAKARMRDHGRINNDSNSSNT